MYQEWRIHWPMPSLVIIYTGNVGSAVPHITSSSGALVQPISRLDISGLDATVQRLFSAGLAPSTRRNYQSCSRRYLSFCNQLCILRPFPVTESILSRFVAFLFESRLIGATVKNYLAAVRYVQIGLGLGDPGMSNMPQLEYVVKGFKRSATYTVVLGFLSLLTSFVD